MKRTFSMLLTLFVLIQLSSCAVTGSYEEQEPQEGKAILVGAILVENFGLGDIYDSKKSNILVKIASKHEENGREVTETYRTTTDPDRKSVV